MKVHVSSLSKYEFCPRTIYLEEALGIKPEETPEKTRGLIGHAIRKELSLRQAKLLGKVNEPKELKSLLLDELENILADAPYIYKEKLSGLDFNSYALELRPQIEKEVSLISRKLAELVKEVGLRRALEKVTPYRVEYTIRSDKLNLSGRVDKIMREETLVPVEIKTGAHSGAVFQGDRLQVCGYVLLMEEEFGETIEYGFVEYVQSSDKKPVLATENLRRQTLAVRDEVQEILGGSVPEICPHGSGKKCETCGLKKECYKI